MNDIEIERLRQRNETLERHLRKGPNRLWDECECMLSVLLSVLGQRVDAWGDPRAVRLAISRAVERAADMDTRIRELRDECSTAYDRADEAEAELRLLRESRAAISDPPKKEEPEVWAADFICDMPDWLR